MAANHVLRQCLHPGCGGPINWNFVHCLAEQYPEDGPVTPTVLTMYKSLVDGFIHCNGCPDCTRDATELLQTNGTQIDYTNRASFRESWRCLHNHISKKLGKKQISEHDYCAKLLPKYANTHFQQDSVWTFAHAVALRYDCESQVERHVAIKTIRLALKVFGFKTKMYKTDDVLFEWTYQERARIGPIDLVPSKQQLILRCTCSSAEYAVPDETVCSSDGNSHWLQECTGILLVLLLIWFTVVRVL